MGHHFSRADISESRTKNAKILSALRHAPEGLLSSEGMLDGEAEKSLGKVGLRGGRSATRGSKRDKRVRRIGTAIADYCDSLCPDVRQADLGRDKAGRMGP
jgi:hypothetical protein